MCVFTHASQEGVDLELKTAVRRFLQSITIEHIKIKFIARGVKQSVAMYQFKTEVQVKQN